MKKLLFFPSLLVAFSLLFFSCSSKDEINEIETSKLSSQKIRSLPDNLLRAYTMNIDEFKKRYESETVYTPITMGESAVFKHNKTTYDGLSSVSLHYSISNLSNTKLKGISLDNRARVFYFHMQDYILHPKFSHKNDLYEFEGCKLYFYDFKNFGGKEKYIEAPYKKGGIYIDAGIKTTVGLFSTEKTSLWVSSFKAEMIFKRRNIAVK